MKNYTIRTYEPNDYDAWNAFVSGAKNATFLFHRDFMEYHSDRFDDYSLLVFEDEKLMALLPANTNGRDIFSHQGLTYGGLIYDEKLKLESVIAVFQSLLEFLSQRQKKMLHLKLVPTVYHKKTAQELDYALFLAEARLVRRDTLSVIDLTQTYSFSEIRKRGIKKGIASQLLIKEENDFESFWNQILIPNLSNRHNAKPTHSLEEIVYLKSKFPKQIRQFNVYHNDTLVAGTTVFETETNAHAQYISGNETKSELGSLDFLFAELITKTFAHKRWFDFGISNENNGKTLNTGLSYWKESFGASIMVHDFYEVPTENHTKLKL